MHKSIRPSLRKKLLSLNQEGKLAIFLGAGVSVGYGLPDWKTLLLKISKKLWKSDPLLQDLVNNENQILTARYARKKSKINFNKIVHDSLYEDKVNISNDLISIALSGIKKICNFNFDDLFEEALFFDGIIPEVVLDGGPYDSLSNGVSVFHPHGFLKRNGSTTEVEDAKLILSEDDYNELYSNPYSWANILQISLLTNYSVVFVGMSLTDPNIRRLLDVVRQNGFTNQHFAILKDPVNGCSKKEKAHYKRVKKNERTGFK